MIRIYITIFLISILTFSCSKKEEVKEGKITAVQYQKGSLSFDLPTGWKVKQDYTDKTGRYLEIDKYADYKVESTLGISILNDIQPSDSVIANQIKQLQFYYQKINFKLLEQNKDLKLGKYNIRMTTYTADNVKNKVYGKICVTQDKNKTLLFQIVDNKPDVGFSDYNTIFNTFTIQ